jgi:GAF domain-containing protein
LRSRPSTDCRASRSRWSRAQTPGLPLIELRKVVPFAAVAEAINGLLVTSPCAACSSLTGCHTPGEQPGQRAGDPDDLLEVLERETAADVELIALASDQRWRQYEVRAPAQGVRYSLSTPLITHDCPAGALNLYAAQPGFFGEADTCLAERFATEASVAVGLAARLAEQAVPTDQLRASLASPAVINQALGIIMAQQRCTARGLRHPSSGFPRSH